jgi:putative ABC transport system ATP-binding protein
MRLSSDVDTPLIELRDASRDFDGLRVLKPVSLAVHHGEYLAITGPSGSGKSTLLNLLGLLDRPSSGSVLVRGEELDRMPDPARSAVRGRTVGFVFQAFHLLGSRTAVQNVELGMLYQGVPAALRRERAVAALNRVGLSHRLSALPTTMSGGEQQRVAIARAVAAEVDLLLADEPTGNLDSETGDKALDLFDSLHASGLALVVVTHNPEVAARASRQFTMVDGVLSDCRPAVTPPTPPPVPTPPRSATERRDALAPPASGATAPVGRQWAVADGDGDSSSRAALSDSQGAAS